MSQFYTLKIYKKVGWIHECMDLKFFDK